MGYNCTLFRPTKENPDHQHVAIFVKLATINSPAVSSEFNSVMERLNTQIKIRMCGYVESVASVARGSRTL